MRDVFLTFTHKTIGYPGYIVGTRKQVVRYPFTASNGKTYSGTILGIVQQLADEGFVSMIGLIPSCLRVFPTQMMNTALKEPIKSFYKNLLILEKDSSFFKRYLYNVLCGTAAGALSLAVVYSLDYYSAVSALPPECVTEPSTIYDIYSGFGLSVFGIGLYRGLYLLGHEANKQGIFPKDLGFMGHFVNITTVVSLICYPLDTIRVTQAVHCCTTSKAISIINDHPDGLWEGYMGGWKEKFVLQVVLGIGFHYLSKLFSTEK
eukprot:g6505.t1